MEKQTNLIPFKPGQSGNPYGRARGSRNRLSDAFIQAFYEDFVEHGAEVIARVRRERPDSYLRVIASLLPRQIEARGGAFDGIDDDHLASILLGARLALGLIEDE